MLAAVRQTRLLFCLTKAEVILEVVRTMSAVLVFEGRLISWVSGYEISADDRSVVDVQMYLLC